MVGIIRSLKKSAFGLRLREKFYPKYDPSIFSPAENLVKSMIRYKNCEHKKNQSEIKKEIEICRKFWKCFPHHYYMYDLYRSDMQLSKEDLINYIPDFFWFYLYLPHHTSYKFGIITDNKIISEHVFKGNKIIQPETICRIIQGRIYSPEMELIDNVQLQNILDHGIYQKIFVKPAEGGRGKGIHIFHKNNYGDYVTSRNIYFNDTFVKTIAKNRDYIIQEGIIQHPEISAIYPESVNTIRIITENKKGNIRVPCAMMRIGRAHNEIDNASAGGIFLKVEVNNGKIGDHATSYENEKFSHHPDTQFFFADFKIPLWEGVLKFVTESAGRLPFFTHLAWDIAISEDGPIAIEANLSPGINGLQLSCGGLREKFGIYNPEYYWKNPGNRI